MKSIATALSLMLFLACGWTRAHAGAFVPVTRDDQVPPPWHGVDIGSPSQSGSAIWQSDTSSFLVSGSGSQIWGASDQLHFTQYRLRADGSLTVRIVKLTSGGSIDPAAAGGIMMRYSLAASSDFVDLVSTTAGVALQWRSASAPNCATSNTVDVTAPCWLRLERFGNLVRGYIAADNNGTPGAFSRIGAPIAFAAGTCYCGLAVCSHDTSTTLTVDIDNVTAAPLQAVSADAFVDSIGVNADQKISAADLKALGVRHVRYGFYLGAGQAVDPKTVDHLVSYAKAGIRATALSFLPYGQFDSKGNVISYHNGSIADIQNTVTQIQAVNTAAGSAGPAIEAVEGTNEPDYYWDHWYADKYNGLTFAQGGAVQYEKDLYTTLKQNPATNMLTVIGAPLAYSYPPGQNPLGEATLTDYVDWGNMHPYPWGGNTWGWVFAYDTIPISTTNANQGGYFWWGQQPSNNIDECPHFFVSSAESYNPMPMACTETGWFTGSAQHSISLTAQAKYVPRLYLEYYRRGVRRTFMYKMRNGSSDLTDSESNYGLELADGSPKPAYIALQSLIDLLREPNVKAGFVPGNLAYSVTVQPPTGYYRTQYVRSLLMEKSTGEYYLVLYNEIADSSITGPDGSSLPGTARDIQPPSMPVTIDFPGFKGTATLYTYNSQWQLEPTPLSISGGQASVSVPDTVTIIKLQP